MSMNAGGPAQPVLRGRTYGEFALGQCFEHAVTVTDTHITLGAGLIGDFNPLHVDDAFARESRYGARILHGVLTSALMGAPVGMLVAGTAIGYLQHDCRFLAPVHAGDTLTIHWTVVERIDKPRHGGGIVAFDGTCENQRGVRVATAHGRMMVADVYGPRPPLIA